jgi:hypothetical protein
MKKILLLSVFVFTLLALGCQPDVTPNNTASNNTTSNNTASAKTLKVLSWGPDQAKVGEIPNKQPNGKMGIWIQVDTTVGLGDMQVTFAGHPVTTAEQPKLVTAGVPPEDIATPGDKTIELKLLSTGEVIPIGTFKVVP